MRNPFRKWRARIILFLARGGRGTQLAGESRIRNYVTKSGDIAAGQFPVISLRLLRGGCGVESCRRLEVASRHGLAYFWMMPYPESRFRQGGVHNGGSLNECGESLDWPQVRNRSKNGRAW